MIIASAQFTARPCDVGANVATMAGLVREAAGKGAALVAFPELAVTGYELAAIAADPGRLALEPDDARLGPLREACRETGTAAVVNCPGTPREAGSGPTISAFGYGPDGAPLVRYDKRHVTEKEAAAGFAAGTEDGGRFVLDGVRIGLAICYDVDFPDIAARAAADGCALLVATSLYGSDGGREERDRLFPALARDHGLYVLLANHVGPAGGYVGCGGSGVWGPDGVLLAGAPEAAPGVVTADVPL
ncbi:carbon-nitrogen hydrolase family protein [Streptomyces mobaraensis NBRC 13819 = DSM 40847]|uniref:Putative hydrolase n=1 Tax=Streptomyces mobaraensis (strain ATCC 29032 / DSM 40847 / JCM 4168 / NBRC 13819 / NCIMB 11159 / IPCR 16-22) TaxID=1223523 RepID=M3BI95_STRM1|nr:carbon-nitrogen hydrolase family protein [Streptomyces mobaraensis]EME99299.1 putative hydrolase [Streptomyces mobaraensis NBRC 13819 = DSM 40847]QTT73692.1 carbon-nitrogen hydrolase family protein [Streptomyces mobaraensis NBRC 13819 = DSM 40847]